MPKKIEWIRVSSAAKVRGVSRQVMYYHINAHNIKTMELDGVKYVDRNAVLEMKETRVDAGQPKPGSGPSKKPAPKIKTKKK